MKNLTIVKIGGSVCTKKASRTPVLQKNALKQLAKELYSFCRINKKPLILCHGAGSFAHPLAQLYSLQDIEKKKKDPVGASLTRLAVQRLNTEIAAIFLRYGLPVFPLSASSLAIQSKGRIISFNMQPVVLLLEKGYIPLLGGDVAIDLKSEVSILSGDQIVSHLCKKLLARRAIFLSDVEGVYSDDPKHNPHATLLRHIKKTARVLSAKHSSKNSSDVTGLMKGKLFEISRISAPVIVCNGLRKGNFLHALQGKNPGTLVS